MMAASNTIRGIPLDWYLIAGLVISVGATIMVIRWWHHPIGIDSTFSSTILRTTIPNAIMFDALTICGGAMSALNHDLVGESVEMCIIIPGSVVVLLTFAANVSIRLVNRPRFLMPARYRQEKGWLAKRNKRR